MMEAFEAIFLFLLIADYLYRAYKSISLIIYYWRMSAMGLPLVDIRYGVVLRSCTAVTVQLNLRWVAGTTRP